MTQWIVRIAVVICALIGVARLDSAALPPVYQEQLHERRVYAYRDWQSVGVKVNLGDLLQIHAVGTWLYTPNEYHGPEGHARYQAPDFYPIAYVPGGVLIGRIGEIGAPFTVGRELTQYADQEGLLYLRINDDILSDNEGSVIVEVTVQESVEQR